MKSNKHILRKCATMLALVVSAVLFLPEVLFAKGAVIGYLWGGNHLTDEQLDRLTHVMAVDLYFDAYGNLLPNPDITNFQSWLNGLVDRAHAKGVQVSICIGHNRTNYNNFGAVTANSTTRDTLVASIANFVDDYDLDGVDIDWERPRTAAEWNQCIALLQELKAALPYKRISIALPHHAPASTVYPNQTIPQQIWAAADALHLMAYDEEEWTTHSDAGESIDAIDAWATWGTSGGRNLNKEKLYIGCAFYGYNMVGNDIDWDDKVIYKEGACGNPGDSPASAATKVNHCYDEEYGGVFAWELGEDAVPNNPKIFRHC